MGGGLGRGDKEGEVDCKRLPDCSKKSGKVGRKLVKSGAYVTATSLNSNIRQDKEEPGSSC